MAHKVQPYSFRLGIVKPWHSRWFLKGKYRQTLEEDEVMRNVITAKIGTAGIAGIEIERTASTTRVIVRAARPGLIIGRGGKGIEELTKAIQRAIEENAVRNKRKPASPSLAVTIEELKRSEIAAPLMAQYVAWDLERRLPFRRVLKKQLEQAMQMRDVKGAKVRVSGRLGGADIARSEWLIRGKLPLQTLRSDIDYGEATAHTTHGAIGIKVWIYKGEIFKEEKSPSRI